MKPEQLKQLQAILPEADRKDLTADNAIERVCAAFSSLSKSIEDSKAKVLELEGKVEAAAKKMAASTISPEVLDQLAEGAEESIDSLACGAKPVISPAVAKDLKTILVGTPAARNTFALSRSVSGTPVSLVKSLVTALKANDVVALGEVTKSQALALSRNVPGENEDDKPAPEIAKAMTDAVK